MNNVEYQIQNAIIVMEQANYNGYITSKKTGRFIVWLMCWLKCEQKMSCECQKCGEKYKMDLILSDELWELITGKKDSGLLCPVCIIKGLQSMNKYQVFILVKG